MGFSPFFDNFSIDFFTDGPGGTCVAEPPIIPAYAIDAEFIELARELIDEFVPTPNASWHSIKNDIVPDANEPWITTRGLTCIWPVRCVFYQDTLQDREFMKFMKGTAIGDGQTNGIFYKTSFTPTLKDVCVWNGRMMTVKFVNEVRVIKDTIIYIVQFGL